MEETDEDLFGSLEGLPSIDTIEEEIVDTSIDEETSVAETKMVTPSGYDSDLFGELPEYTPETVDPTGVLVNDTVVSSEGDAVPLQDPQKYFFSQPSVANNYSENPEEFMELDERLQDIIVSGNFEVEAKEAEERGAVAATEYRQRPDVVEQVESYEINLRAAKQRDEQTGENTAAMLPNPLAIVDAENYKAEVHVKHFKKAVQDVNALLNDPNPLRASAVSAMVDKGIDLRTINTVVTGADFAPITGAVLGVMDIPQNISNAAALWKEGNEGAALGLLGLSLVELVTAGYGTKIVTKSLMKKVKDIGGTNKQMAQILDANIKTTENKKKLASKVAGKNKVISQKLIDEMEESVGFTLSTGSKGKKVLSGELARTAGREISKDVMDLQNEIAGKYAAVDNKIMTSKAEKTRLKENIQTETGISETQAYTGLTDEVDDFVSPLVIPEKFDAVVAIASDLKKAHPKYFSKDKTIIDSLFELTVNKDLVDSQDLADMLAKYGLTFDDYVLTVVGSGSEAGKILNKLSQIRRAGSLDEVAVARGRTLEKSQNAILSTWRRIENMRRGGMVSMIKTAARNFQSATVRAPMETLENIFDTTLLNMSNEFAGKQGQSLLTRSANAAVTGAKTLVSPSNFKGSTRALQRIYLNPVKAKEITDYILDRPEFQKQFSALFDNVNEYQKATGRGKGGALDGVLSKGEDVINMLNIPNRVQEFVIRRGVFMGELERLVKRNYNVELMDVLKEGKLSDLMSNSSKVRPKGSPQFAQLIEDSTRRALDVTYAKAPDVPLFAEVSNFLTRTGLTAVTTPFPRFMFNSMELMAQYSGGSFNPAIKRALGMKKGPLDAKDRQNISRNLSGLVGFSAAYMYRNSEDAPAEYKEINSKEGTVIDVTAQYPMRQFLWMAEAVKRLSVLPKSTDSLMGKVTRTAISALPPVAMGRAIDYGTDKESKGEGTFDDWFDGKEAAETFLGASARTGASNIFIDEIASLLSGSDDLVKDERKAKAIGRLVGDYLTTWAIPLTQVVEIQRMTGDRPARYVDMSTDDSPTIGGEISRSFRQRGISNLFSPSTEADNERREFLYSSDKQREELGTSLALGITQFTKDSDYGEYLTEKGFNEFKVGSRSRLPSIRRAETKILKQYLPILVENAQASEAELRKEYRGLSSNDPTKKQYTVEQYVNSTVVAMLDEQIRDAKSLSREERKMESEPQALILEKFRGLNSSIRKYAMTEFFKENKEPADILDPIDMETLLAIAEGFKEGVSLN